MRPRKPLPLLLLFLISCQPFEYSPTDLESPHKKPELNLANLRRIAEDSVGPRNHFKIAVMADTHLWYDELTAAVARINQDSSIDFVIVAGDITKFGYADEYSRFANRITRLDAPVLVAIGNHDVQADGKNLFRRIFGPMNFSFTYRGSKFIFFNDNGRGIRCCVPDFPWLDSELAGAGDSLKPFTVSHAPPLTDQLDSTLSHRLMDLYARYHVELSINGHTHMYAYGEPFGDGIRYLVADDIGSRNYCTVTLSDTTLTVEQVFF